MDMKKLFSNNTPESAARYFLNKMTFTTGPVELDRMMKENRNDINIIDVRAKEDYDMGHIPTALSLPKENWKSMQGLNRDKINVLYCYSQVCHLAATAGVEFSEKGYRIMELEGGFETWTDYKFDVEK